MDIKFVVKIMIVSVCVCVMCPREDSMTKILCKQMYKTKHIIIKFFLIFYLHRTVDVSAILRTSLLSLFFSSSNMYDFINVF